METIIEETKYFSQKTLKQILNTKSNIDDIRLTKDKSVMVVCKNAGGLLGSLSGSQRQETKLYSEKEFADILNLPENTEILNITHNKKQLSMLDSVAIKIKYKEG